MEFYEKIVLRMPKTEADGDNGINDGNIETYKNVPMLSLTKEEEQNSTDGSLPNCSEPVIVEFNEFMLDSNSLFDKDHLIDVYTKNRAYWDAILINDKKAVKFFDNALDILQKPQIRCLRISDKNTTGLSGINKKSSPWRNLVKNRGVSDKPGHNGGSFGIGKDAAFACSQLRIVFYNTINDEGEKAFQGVVKLPSYQDGNECYDGFGYFCNVDQSNGKFEPFNGSISLDPSYTREFNQTGMDKFIIGFDESIVDLKNEIIISSLNNFLYAFFNNVMIVRFGDVTISKETLSDLMERYSNDKRLYTVTKEYYQVLIAPDQIYTTKVFEEEDIKIYLKLDSTFSRRAAIVRQSGMKVFDKGHLSGSVGFSAVVVLAGNEANKYFKKLENAEHNQWSEFRGSDEREIKNNQAKIFDFLRDKIQELHQINFEASIDADGMNEYLPYTYITGKKKNTESLTNKVEDKVKVTKRKKKTEAPIDETLNLKFDEQGDIIERTDHPNDEPPSDEPNSTPNPLPDLPLPTPNENGEEKRYKEDEDGDFVSKKKVGNDKVKFRLYKSNDEYDLQFESSKNMSKGFIEINISGEQVTVPVKILEAKMGTQKLKFRDNKIVFANIKSKSVQNITFKIDNGENWALEVSVYESKK